MKIRSNRSVTFLLTFIVALCSIAYEGVYAELLRMIFGGALKNYFTVIGAFMAAFAIGAVLSNYIPDKRRAFFRVELLLAVIGPGGVPYIIVLNALMSSQQFPGATALAHTLSYVPVLLVGMLSGFEMPFLSSMVDTDTGVIAASFERHIVPRIWFMHVPDDDDHEGFSDVLSVDYLGSLVGSVGLALYLRPTIGLINSAFLIGALNGVAAITFYLAYHEDGVRARAGVVAGTTGKAIFLACLLLTGTYAGLIVQGDAAEETLTRIHLTSQIEGEHQPGDVDVTIREHETTAYQEVVRYDRKLQNSPREQCVRLDNQVQMCDSWVDSYHHGLVDVPATFYENMADKRVLVIGGGDWIAANHLREYNVTVDQVDLDEEFYTMTKNHSYFEQYHDNAYEYDKLNVTHGDAFQYLQQTDKTYDLILFDAPGIKSEKLLPLYSTEFYTLARQTLADEGVLATWAYDKYWYGDHNKAYMNTVRDAGFTQYYAYDAWEDLDNDTAQERTEQFYILSDGHTPEPDFSRHDNAYVQANANRYANTTWEPIPTYRGVRVNHMFHPNYNILVEN